MSSRVRWTHITVQPVAQALATHRAPQQSAPTPHAAPTSLQVAAGAPHVGGAPPQRPLAQSVGDMQLAPSASGAAVQTGTPAAPGEQVPRQQSPFCTQGVPFGRQLPAPKSQRDVVSSHAAQHGVPPPDVQFSPVGRHVATGSMMHLRSVVEQMPPQQSALMAHASPYCLQSAPPHAPALQASEQQSSARVHAAPSGRQYGKHARVAVFGTGSQRPLQHSAREVHVTLGPEHVPGSRQTLPMHREEQQSTAATQAAPLA
jgi:hypothetical protein